MVAGKGAVPRTHVRQPLQPVPAFPGLRGRDGRDDNFRGRVEARELQHHAPGDVVHQAAGTGNAQGPGGAQLGYDGNALDVAELL
ncbi:hypothetical protein D3C85_1726030 [compost metagenome]